MTVKFDDIGIYNEPGYTYDGDLIGNGKPPKGTGLGGMVKGKDEHLTHKRDSQKEQR